MFDLTYENYTTTLERYAAYAYGVDNSNNQCFLVLLREPIACGYYPFYWSISHIKRHGELFASEAEAYEAAQLANIYNANVKNIDVESITIVPLKVTTTQITETFIPEVNK